EAADCTIEEREEYEPIIAEGGIVYAGVDYEPIAEQAAEDADILIWDGGNNDFSFLRPNLQIVVTDALRPDHLTTHHPGETTLRMADIAVINKTDPAKAETVAAMEQRISELAPGTAIVRAASPARLEDPESVKGKRVVVVEDGPTITHGGVSHGAGLVAAESAGAEIVDPRDFVDGELAALYRRFPHIGPVLPAMGYDEAQIRTLEAALKAAAADAIIAGTPIHLGGLVDAGKPVIRARYGYQDAGEPKLTGLVDEFLAAEGLG
ncbi:MAG: GTPase, partial [Alphaproteobacteria bacterium]|nr:GTPase [Alphaproteobacteria bacterium]